MVTGLSQSSTSKFSGTCKSSGQLTGRMSSASSGWSWSFILYMLFRLNYIMLPWQEIPQIQWGEVPERSFRAVTQASLEGDFLLLFWCTANCRLVLRLSPSMWPHLVLKLIRNSGFILNMHQKYQAASTDGNCSQEQNPTRLFLKMGNQ